MKNFLLFFVAVIQMLYGSACAQMNTPPVCNECPKAFQGFNVGANIGYGVGGTTTKVKRFGTTIINNVLVTQGSQASNRVDVRGVDGGLSIGYLHRFCNFVSGIDFTANWVGSNTSAKSVSMTTANGANIAGSVTARASYKVRLENSLQLAAKLGWAIDRTLPFIKLGWDNSQWQISGNAVLGNNSLTRASKDKRFNAFLWGVGVDFLMTRNFTLGLEYTGTVAGSKNIIKVNDAAVSLKPQYNKFALTVKYIFS